MNVPHQVRPYADQVVVVTDAVCLQHLDIEYADSESMPRDRLMSAH